MNNKKMIYIVPTLCLLFLISACGNPNPNSSSPGNSNTQPSETNSATASGANPETTPTNEEVPDSTDEEILIIIDQTPKPIEGNMFEFVISKLPEGFTLAQMQWISPDNMIINSLQDAIQHGANGEDGFYISGDGQFMGFIYPDSMKGDVGKVIFLFQNAEGKELTWKKEITLD